MYYYAAGNGTKYLERMRIRTPTSQNIAGMTMALKGCEISDVNMIVLTIDPALAAQKGKTHGWFQTWQNDPSVSFWKTGNGSVSI